MIRLALIGCGEHSRGSHAAPLAKYRAIKPNEISLVAACDINLGRAQQFCRDFGFTKAYSDIDELLKNERIDACVTVMPVELIAGVAIKLLKKGVPCVIEKPLGTSITEIEHLAAVARETGTPHLVSVNRRFFPFLKKAILWAEKQGRIQYVRATMIRHKRSEPDFIWSTAIHAVDAVRQIAGEIKNFKAQVFRRADLSANWFHIPILFENGALGSIEILPTAGVIEETYEFFGGNFRARIVAGGSGTQHSLQCWHGGNLEIEEIASENEEYINNGGFAEVCEFVQALQSAEMPQPSIEDVLPSARICFAIADQASLAESSEPF
jgi:predicted dehydrogenase